MFSMAQPVSREARTASSAAMQGSMCLVRMKKLPEPMLREKSTKFMLVNLIVAVRIMRAYQAHLMKMEAMTTFSMSTPSRATTARMMIWLGKESMTSTTRMMISSTAPRKYPAVMPMTTPMPMGPSIVRRERKRVGRIPKSMRENTQRPR